MKRVLNGLRWTLGILALGGALSLGGAGLAGLMAGGGAWADEEGEGEAAERIRGEGGWAGGGTVDPLYVEECSACHLAYPAALLPARSWQAIMSGLETHFGENAALMPETAQRIGDYLATHAADAGQRPSRFVRSLGADETPLRITELRGFRREHEDIPQRLVGPGAEVQSFSQCQACHGSAAERGVFDEDTVDIPGFGRWDD